MATRAASPLAFAPARPDSPPAASQPAAAPRAAASHGGLAPARLAAFAAIALPISAAALPLNLFVPQLYASEFGIPLALIGVIFLAGRIWDVAADPLVGALSDRTRSRFGRRKPWIAVGGLLFGLTAAALFFPPRELVGPAYLAVVLFAFYFAWSMIEIPSSAWAGEVSSDYHGRTRVVSYRAIASAIGLLAVLVLPTIIDQVDPGNGTLKLQVVGAFVVLTLLPALVLTLGSFREVPVPAAPAHKTGLLKAAGLVFGDRLLLRVLVSDAAVTLGQSIRGGLIVFFVVWYMELPAWASGLYLLQFVFGVFSAPIWSRIGYRFGKRNAAILGELAQAAINLSLIFVFPGMLGLLIALTIAQGLTQGSGNLMLRAMVTDVADAHRLRTGHDRNGLFCSVFALSAKLGPAIGIGLALPLVAWLGFAPQAGNSPAALEGLKYVFALGPALSHLLATLIIWRFPLDEQAHAEIRRELELRDAIPA
jgi:Na+/melibiose symporter-like transporter